MKTLTHKHIDIMPILPAILILAGTVLFLMTCWPSGITVDRNNNIKLGAVIGKGRKIPVEEITITEVPDDIFSHLVMIKK